MKFLLIILMLTGCTVEQSCEDDNSCQSNLNSSKDDSDKVEEKEEVVEVVEEELPRISDTRGEWYLDELEYEEGNCEDDYYMFIPDNYTNFCRCFIEKLSFRWGYESYLRNKNKYAMRLARNGSLNRCKESDPFNWHDESDEDLEDDIAFDPEEIIEEDDEEEETEEDEDDVIAEIEELLTE